MSADAGTAKEAWHGAHAGFVRRSAFCEPELPAGVNVFVPDDGAAPEESPAWRGVTAVAGGGGPPHPGSE